MTITSWHARKDHATTMTNARPAAAEGTLASKSQLTVLLAEDDDELRSLVADLLRREGHRVMEARDGHDLMASLACAYLAGSESKDVPLLVTDLRLPIRDSLSVIRALQQQGQRPHFILMTAFGDAETHAEAARLGALAVLDKPFDLEDLRSAVVQFARRRPRL
jgi:CheY-like chemotaxis protein